MKTCNCINSQPASFCREERNSTIATISAAKAARDVAGAAEVSSGGESATPRTAAGLEPLHELIKLAIDAHGKFHVVARQEDNAVAQPPQKFDEEQLLKFIAKQKTLA